MADHGSGAHPPARRGTAASCGRRSGFRSSCRRRLCARRPAAYPLELAPRPRRAGAGRRCRSRLPRQLPLPRAGVAQALPTGGVSRPVPVPRLGRRSRSERRRPSVPPRLSGQSRHAAQARRCSNRLRGDRSVDHLARDDRRDRDASALDLGDGDERVGPSRPAADRRRLRHRVLHAARRRPASACVCRSCAGAAVYARSASTSPVIRRRAGAETRSQRGSTCSPAGRRVPSAAPPCSPRSGSRSRLRPRSR